MEDLEIHHSEVIKVEGVQADWTFKGYQKYGIQNLLIQPYNTCYRLEQWERADGTYVIAPSPISYLLYQYHHQHVTQPLLLEQIQGLGIKISSAPPWVFPMEDVEHFLEVGLVDGRLDYRQNLQDTAFRLRVRPVGIKPFFNIHQNVVKREYLLEYGLAE